MIDDYQKRFSDSTEIDYICEFDFILTDKNIISTTRPHVFVYMFEISIHPNNPRANAFGPNWSVGLKYRENMLHYIDGQDVGFTGLSWQSAVEKTKHLKLEVDAGEFDDEISRLQSLHV